MLNSGHGGHSSSSDMSARGRVCLTMIVTRTYVRAVSTMTTVKHTKPRALMSELHPP